jgi:cytochrome c oxidase subunit 3
MSEQRRVLDISSLPTHETGPRNPLWWGTQFFMVIEGLAFAFAIATYLYFYAHNPSWPLGNKGGLVWPSVLLAVFVLSEIPNVLLKRAADAKDLRKVRIGIIIMSLIGLLALVLRVFEFTTIYMRWDENAYTSITWFLLGLHTTHLLTDVVETWVMSATLFIGPVDMRRFAEVEDNQDYWHFVVGFWAVIYFIIYLIPRWFEVPA